jgi:hypothetical protein
MVLEQSKLEMMQKDSKLHKGKESDDIYMSNNVYAHAKGESTCLEKLQ